MNKKLIKFTDGTYGVRKGWFSYKYQDMKTPNCWWYPTSEYFRDCKSDFDTAKLRFNEDQHEVIDG